MNIKVAQSDMREAYYNGAPGILVSGMVWIVAGIIALTKTQQSSVLVFFIGGMFIYPLGMLLSKALGRSGKHKKDNPLASLAFESTLLLFIGLFMAFAILQIQPNWFFPIMLLTIGGRYVIFNSLYGLKIYWLLGLALVGLGVTFFFFNDDFYLSAVLGGATELVFAIVIYFQKNKKK